MKRLKTILSTILDIDEESIRDDTSPENVESWDSFNGLMMVSELEKTFSVHFTIEEINAVKSVKDIRDSLQRHGVVLTND